MSFCPSKDIHSVYLDGELPEMYKAEYESHLKICPECQKELENLKKIHGLFEADSKSISLNENYLDQSFDKLMVKMNYSKNTKQPERKFLSSIKYVIPTAAAAAIVALVVPLRLTSANGKVPQNSVNPVVASVSTAAASVPSATNVSVGGGKGVVISGNINESVLPSVTDRSVNPFIQSVSSNSGLMERRFYHDVDVFRPAFNEDKTIPIKITVPGMNSVVAEFYLPAPVITGHFE